MYRVELKVSWATGLNHTPQKFLMYRVELKDNKDDRRFHFPNRFLMYRVELKVGRVCGRERRGLGS